MIADQYLTKMFRKKTCIIFIFAAFAVFGLVRGVAAAELFFIVKEYDFLNRTEVQAELIKLSPKLYWYAERDWWEGLSLQEKEKVELALNNLTEEFESKIYPDLTFKFGSERSLGAPGERRITVLLHRMRRDAEGYWSSKDEYDRLLVPDSNQRKMVYMAADKITDPLMKSALAHEFMHLIVFNQKTVKQGVQEEVWLNEAIAEMAPRYLGYDNIYKGSNLERRVQEFLSRTDASLLDWGDEPHDYAAVNMFMQYFVDKYGWEVITSAIKNEETGIASLNLALEKQGFKEKFDQIFTNWTLALILNDCTISELHCYSFPGLKDFGVAPRLYFLPTSGKGILSISLDAKTWAPNFHKFLGGNNDFILEFTTPPDVAVKLPYIITYADGSRTVRVIEIAKGQTHKIEIPNFGEKVISLTILPSIQEGGVEASHLLFWRASVSKAGKDNAQDVLSVNKSFLGTDKAGLLRKITELNALVEELRAKIRALGGANITAVSCSSFERNLFYGMKGSEISCLQEFLKAQGPEIYPEGLVTGNFLELTRKAVIRFQEKNAADILTPLGLSRGTGFVGALTRAKINELLR